MYTNTSRNKLISLPAETCDGQNGQEQGWKNQQKRIFAVEIQEHMKYQMKYFSEQMMKTQNAPTTLCS